MKAITADAITYESSYYHHNPFIAPKIFVRSQEVSIFIPHTEYCRFCGSQDIIDFLLKSRISRGSTLEPKVDFGGTELPDNRSITPISLTAGSVHNNSETWGAYQTRRCRICSNNDVSTGDAPLELFLDHDETAKLVLKLQGLPCIQS